LKTAFEVAGPRRWVIRGILVYFWPEAGGDSQAPPGPHSTHEPTERTGLRITYVVTRAEPIGGVQIHVRDLALSLKQQGHSPSVLVGSEGAFVNSLRDAGVAVGILPHLTVPISPLGDLRALGEIRAELRRQSPDLVALHSSKAGILGRIAARSLSLPALLTAHGWNFTPGIAPMAAAVYRQIERMAGRISTRIITVSEYDRRLALEAGLAPTDRVVAVHNGIPDIPVELRATPDRPRPRLVMIARFEAQKDHPTLLRALAGLRQAEWELDLIGDGPLAQRMQSLAVDLGLRDRINFLGQRMDVPQRLADAQVSLLVTNWEGLPLSVLEAMRAGLPVIATDVAGIGEAISDGDSGYLVPRGDVRQLQDRIGRLLGDPRLRLRQGQAARARYERHFTLEQFVGRTLAVYEDVLAERKSGRVRVNEKLVAASGA
jgi:glycosyltransferase involved in cell wall biosynthesis